MLESAGGDGKGEEVEAKESLVEAILEECATKAKVIPIPQACTTDYSLPT